MRNAHAREAMPAQIFSKRFRGIFGIMYFWNIYIKVPYRSDMIEVNQDNLHLLLPGKIHWLVEYLHDDYGYSLQDCLTRIYHSKLYKKLSLERTKYWHLGPVDLYEELKKEL